MESINVVERSSLNGPDFQIPAVMYGKSLGSRPIFVKVPQQKALHWHEGSKFTLDFEGNTFKGTLEEIQTDAIGTMVKHLSFHIVSKDEITKVEVPVTTKSDREPPKGSIITIMLNHVTLKGKLSKLPEELVVDVSKMEMNDMITMADIDLPTGVEFGYGQETHLEDKVLVVCKPANATTSGVSENEGAENPEETPMAEAEQESSQEAKSEST